MAKEYSIKINGVQESINALDALISKAEELGRKLSGGITVDVKPQVQQPANTAQSQAAEKAFTVQAQITAEVEKQNAALSQQSTLVQASAGGYKEALDAATAILGTYDENIAKLAEYDAKLKDIAAQKKKVQDIGVENEQTRQIMQELLADEIKYKQLKSETLSVIKTETKLLQSTEGSYDQMAATVGRLRDALRASGGNLSPEQFEVISTAVSDLDKQLKDADKGMGQFFRNVGNYPSAAEGFSKIKVEIAGITQEFDGAKPAIMSLRNAMSQLAVEGKTDTDEYRALAEQMRNLQLAMVQVNDEIEKSKDASSGLHDTIELVQGFTAIATIGQGFSQLFGMDDSAITEQIKKMTTLMGIMQGLNELRNQMATGTGIGPALNKLMNISGLNSSLTQLKSSFSELIVALKSVRTQSEATAVGFDVMAASAKVASAAVKSLWRALLVGLVIEAVVWLVEGLVDGIKALYNIIHDYVSVSDDAEAANTALAHSYELVRQQIDNYNEARDHEVARGEISKEISDLEKMLNIQQQLTKYAGVTEGAFRLNAENADITPVLHQYGEFEQRLQEINEKNEQGLKIGSEMDKLYSDVLADLAARWLEVDKNDQQAIEGFMEWYKQAPLYQSAVKWAIDTGNDSMKQFAGTINEAFNNVSALINEMLRLQSATTNLREELELREKYGDKWQTEQRVRQSNREVDNSNLSEEERKKLKAAREKEIRESAQHGRNQVSVAKRTSNDLLNIERQLQQDRLAIMRDGLTKTLTQLEYERHRRLEEANKNIADVKKREEAISLINQRYDKQVADARRKWREEYLKDESEFNANLRKQNQELLKQELESEKAQSDIGLDGGVSRLEAPSKDLSGLSNYYEAEFKLKQSWLAKNLEIQKKLNDIEAEQGVDSLSKELDERRKALVERYELLLNDEKAIEESGKTKVQLQEQFDNEMLELETSYRSREGEIIARNQLRNTEATNEYTNDVKSAYADMYSSIINGLNKFASATDRANARLKPDNTNAWGFFDIKNFRKQRDEVLKNYDGILRDIGSRMQSLREDFGAGKISLGDFSNAYSELEQLKERISDAMAELKGDNGMEDFMKGADAWVQQIGQAANQILSSVFDIRNSEFERMREELDKQIELVEEKYDEMEQLAQRHKEAMEEIEDELTTARGDRRQHLIDTLSAEIDAQRKALAEQKKAEKEKKRLEEEGDRLELKRKQEQKRQSLITAVINAALAISQAAANKWPIPAIPLMALAAATGAAQVAAISAQKYAQGGLLQGPTHERGGIKVGGGIEVEGGEFVTNRSTTSKNLDLLYYINSSRKRLNIDDFIDFYSKGAGQKPLLGAKGKFEDGGLMPSLEIASRVADVIVAQDDRPVIVSVVDINDAQARVRRVQTMAGLER